jgi:ankyrin repeat protein
MRMRVDQVRQCRVVKHRRRRNIRTASGFQSPTETPVPERSTSLTPSQQSSGASVLTPYPDAQVFDGQIWSFWELPPTSPAFENPCAAKPEPVVLEDRPWLDVSFQVDPQTSQCPSIEMSDKKTVPFEHTVSESDKDSASDQQIAKVDCRTSMIDFTSARGLMKRLSSRRASSCMDVLSLLCLSDASSWRSSLISSVGSLRWKGTPSIKEEPTIRDEVCESTVLNHKHDCLSNDVILTTCCRSSETCIHRTISRIATYCARGQLRDNWAYLWQDIDVFAKDPFENGSLHLAAKWGLSLDVLNYITFSGVDENAVNAAGQTFLHFLDPLRLRSDIVDFTRYICRPGLKLEAQDHFGRTFLHSLVQNSDFKMDDLMMFFPYPALSPSNIWTLVHAQDVDGVSVALKWCQLMEKQGDTHHPLLRRYCSDLSLLQYNQLKFHPYLPLRNIYISSNTYSQSEVWAHTQRILGGPASLHALAQARHWPSYSTAKHQLRQQMLRTLIEEGADVNDFREGLTPLMSFIVSPRDKETNGETSKLVSYLINRGANVHRRTRNGETALTLACARGMIPTTAVLLHYGANPHARTVDGSSVLEVAYAALKKAKKNEALYSKIWACKTMVTEKGGIANPEMKHEFGSMNRGSRT